MARTMNPANTTLYRSLVTKERTIKEYDVDYAKRWNPENVPVLGTVVTFQEVYGPYTIKSSSRDYSYNGNKTTVRVQRQELKPVFHLTSEGNITQGLEWITYKESKS